MDSAHDRFETLAVGHVLGGLEASDDREFRTHLQRCGACRRRVAELRGIADDLAEAERDERERARVRTVAPSHAQLQEPPAAPVVTTRTLGVLVLVTLTLLATLGFWNLHLRTQVAAAVGAGERSELALRTIAEGQALEAELDGTVRGEVISDGARVALALSGLPRPAADEAIVVWRLGGEDGDEPALATRPDDGHLAATIELGTASAVVVTLEPLRTGSDGPTGRELVRAELGTP